MFEIIEKLSKKLKVTSVLLITVMASVSSLSGIEITREFYPKENIPKEYLEAARGDPSKTGDLSIITVEEWPIGSTVHAFTNRLSLERREKTAQMTLTNEIPGLKQAIYSIGYIPGEPVTFIFEDPKLKLHEEVTIIPAPIYAISKEDGAKIEAKISLFSPLLYRIELTGFKENEILQMKSLSYDEEMENLLSFDKATIMLYSPEVIHKKGGVGKLFFKRSSGEILELEVPWGLEWLKYDLFMDEGKIKCILECEGFQKENPEMMEYFNSKKRN